MEINFIGRDNTEWLREDYRFNELSRPNYDAVSLEIANGVVRFYQGSIRYKIPVFVEKPYIAGKIGGSAKLKESKEKFKPVEKVKEEGTKSRGYSESVLVGRLGSSRRRKQAA